MSDRFKAAQRAYDNQLPEPDAWFVCRQCGQRSAESERAQDAGRHICNACDDENGFREVVRLINGELMSDNKFTIQETDAWREYDSAAEWCANRGIKGEVGDPLPENMGSPGAIDYIQADPEAFQARVRLFAYAKAMRGATCGRD